MRCTDARSLLLSQSFSTDTSPTPPHSQCASLSLPDTTPHHY
uniref:Uncharacterized protein n=1 Tax=Rhizophora mucronata TaxID=61149 RepID=A0A2P2LCP7_RHIMU